MWVLFLVVGVVVWVIIGGGGGGVDVGFFFVGVFSMVDYIVEYDYDVVYDDELIIWVGEIIRNVKKL